MSRFIKRTKPLSLVIIFAFIFNSISIYLPTQALAWHYPYDQGHKTTQPQPPEPTNPPSNPNQDEEGDDVNIKTGNFSYSHQDLFIPGRGLSIDITRTYNSQDKYNGILGYGWNFTYDLRLYRVEDSGKYYIVIRQGDGIRYKFTENPDGTYVSPLGRYLTLIKPSPEEYTFTTKEGIRYKFAYGLLVSITDPNNNQLNFAYTPEGRLLTLTDTSGRKLNFSYGANGKLAAIKDWIDRSITYDYNSNGDLTSVTDPLGNTIQYTYDAEHNLTAVTDAKGTMYLKNWYDSEERVYQQFFNGGYYYFGYYPSSSYTIVTDRRGYKTTHYYNATGNPIKIVDPLNKATVKTWDTNMNLLSETAPLGNKTSYTYDANGNILTTTDAQSNVTTFTYEPTYNRITSKTDPKGNAIFYEYDGKGNLLKITFPEVGGIKPTTTFTYNQFGQVETMIGVNGIVTKYEYEPTTGYLTKVINDYGDASCINATTSFTYDAVGNVTSITDAQGNTTAFEYNALNKPIKTVSPAPFNYQTKYYYDNNSNLIKIERQADENGSVWQVTENEYDVYDQLIKIKQELMPSIILITQFQYDANGNRTKIIDAEGNATSYTYDARDQLWKVTDALGNITEYTYDANRNLKQIKDAKANITTYDYDTLERLIKTVYADGSYESYTYDKNSNLISKRSRKGDIITYAYDTLNRLMTKAYPDNSKVNYTYDIASCLTSLIDSNGTVSYTYDNLNRITQVQYPDAKTISYEYDKLGNRTKLNYPDSTYITYTYDELNRLTAIKDQSGANISSYTYDTLSRRTQLDLANNTQSTYQYDNANRLLNLANKINGGADISTFAYTYDKVGNRLSMTTAQGIHNYTYDKIYQLIKTDYPAGFTFPDITFNYDSVGNRTSTVNGGTTNYTSNNLNQYTSAGSAIYTYDANGNLTSDGTWTYTYDYENRLTSAANGITTANYKYDASGRRIEKDVNGVKVAYFYDGDQLIAEYNSSGNLQKKYVYGFGIDEILWAVDYGLSTNYYYHFDGLGSVTNLTNSTGSTSETYTYDAFGHPIIKDASGSTLQVSGLGNRFMFTGREYDPETGLYYYRARYYDPRIGRFLQRDPVGYVAGVNFYTYCSNNPVNWVDPMGLWWSWKGAARGIVKVGVGIGVGLVIVGATFVLLPEAAATVVISGLAIAGAAGLGLITGQVITGQTLTGKKLSSEKRSEMAVESLAGWVGLGIASLKTPYWQYYPAENPGYQTQYMTRGWQPPYQTGEEASRALNLPSWNPGTAVREVKVPWWQPVAGPRPVAGGTGSEYYQGWGFPK